MKSNSSNEFKYPCELYSNDITSPFKRVIAYIKNISILVFDTSIIFFIIFVNITFSFKLLWIIKSFIKLNRTIDTHDIEKNNKYTINCFDFCKSFFVDIWFNSVSKFKE